MEQGTGDMEEGSIFFKGPSFHAKVPGQRWTTVKGGTEQRSLARVLRRRGRALQLQLGFFCPWPRLLLSRKDTPVPCSIFFSATSVTFEPELFGCDI
ncbi:hypothetical protein MHYP_G00321920 [Metynnis hypsauchen]